MTDNPQPDRIPIGRNVTYAVRGMPEVANQYGPGFLVPTEVSLTYRSTEDSQLGRFHAYVKGHWHCGGDGIGSGLPLPGQHYYGDPAGWPEWLAAEARLHDPEAAAPADPPAILRELASSIQGGDVPFNTEAAEAALKNGGPFALIAYVQLAIGEHLRRMADEAQQPAPLRAELKPWQLLGDVPDEPLPQTERLAGGRRLTRDEAQQPETRKACGCGQDGCEYCDVDEEQPDPCSGCRYVPCGNCQPAAVSQPDGEA